MKVGYLDNSTSPEFVAVAREVASSAGNELISYNGVRRTSLTGQSLIEREMSRHLAQCSAVIVMFSGADVEDHWAFDKWDYLAGEGRRVIVFAHRAPADELAKLPADVSAKLQSVDDVAAFRDALLREFRV